MQGKDGALGWISTENLCKTKIDKTKILITIRSLMKVESIAECSNCNILQYF